MKVERVNRSPAARAAQKLELPEILRQLATLCRFSVAAERARQIAPSADPTRVRYLLDVTSEGVRLLTQFPQISVGAARDIRELAIRAEKGARLQPADLILVIDTLRAGRELRKVFQRLPGNHASFPNLMEIADGIQSFSTLENDLNRAIGPRGDVVDGASPGLARIRRDVRIAHSRLHERLQSLVSGRHASALQESIVTIREGRYVIPVRAEARAQVKGVVHDTSASGQTLYIEPFDVVELNNRWRELQLDEQREIDRILDELSGKVGVEQPGIERMIEAIAAIDLALAKARLADQMEATRPHLFVGERGQRTRDDDPGHAVHQVRLVNARHPLIDPGAVVPTTIELGERFRVLLITGPNTGGKTVALKTVGLLTLMAQSGLFIPADEESVVSVFTSVFVDIGDEQSIEQSLSTFSSHIRNIIQMLEHVNADSLVLLDEVGAGTDPQEGSALARAIITELLRKRALVVATTHYPEVKAFAYATAGAENASVEFDLASLRPTYRLMIGIPGRSNALSIAERLGMPKRIVTNAHALLDPGDEDAQQLIDDIRRRRDSVTQELARARQTEEEARELRLRAARVLREAEEIRQRARDEAIAEVREELADAREAAREIDRQRHDVARAAAVPDRSAIHRSLKQAEESVRTVQRKKQPRPGPPVMTPAPIRAGDRVRVLMFDEQGDVLSVIGNEAEVQLGAMKVRQPLDRLERVGKAKTPKMTSSASIARSHQAAVGNMDIELDIRGKRAEEVGTMVESYVNDAYLLGMPFVRIIHGKGTGALRTVVRDLLREIPVVVSATAAGANEGGEGATVVHLREG